MVVKPKSGKSTEAKFIGRLLVLSAQGLYLKKNRCEFGPSSSATTETMKKQATHIGTIVDHDCEVKRIPSD